MVVIVKVGIDKTKEEKCAVMETPFSFYLERTSNCRSINPRKCMLYI